MEIYLVRHTTPKIEKGICYGQSDLEVADSFEKEAKVILAKIPDSGKRKIYSSPLQRCKLLADLFDDEVVVDKRLLEFNFGAWELKKWDDIPQEEFTPWMEDFVNVTVPKGESYVELDSRVMEFYNELKEAEGDQIIIVAHSGVIRSILANLKGLPLKESFDIKLSYGQVSKITINKKIRIVDCI